MTADDQRDLELGRLVRQLAERLGLGCAATPAVYTQAALPPGCTSRGSYLRRHRQRVRERVAGWTCAGSTRSVTAEAWALDVDAETSRPRRSKAPAVSATPVANDVSAQLDAALGIRARRAP